MAKAATHCICCGKKGVRWPKWRPQVCAMRCAANRWLADDRPPLYCWQCSEPPECCGCPTHPDDDDEGGGA